jgi:uncharacterized Zn finger protein
MEIPINQFEQYIDEKILKRGLEYFKKGKIHPPEMISPGEFTLVVEGTEDYDVFYLIKNEVMTMYHCTCPYDLGPVCKHLAGTLFYLQKEVLNLDNPTLKLKTVKNKAVKNTVSDKINDILNGLSVEELKDYIILKCKENKTFRNEFLASFSNMNSEETLEMYSKEINLIIKGFLGKKGIIYRNESREVAKLIHQYLDNAHKQMHSNNYQSALYICFAVLENMTIALDFADDSNGDIGSCIDYSLNLLESTIAKELSEENKKMIFDYATNAYKKELFKGWDWHLGILKMVTEIQLNNEQYDIILNLINESNYQDYYKDQAQLLELKIYQKTKTPKERDKFIDANLSNSHFRREKLKDLIQKAKYEDAIQVAQDGIENDKKSKPGLAKEWYEWLLQISQKQDNKEKIIEYARYLFIDNFHPQQDHFQILKDKVDSKEWNSYVDEIVLELKSNKYFELYRIGDIYVRENRISDLFKLLEKYGSLESFAHFEKHLLKNYANELVSIYETEIYDFLEHNVSRSHYKNACRYLRKMIKYGGRDKVNEMKIILSEKYKMRKALLEELNLV